MGQYPRQCYALNYNKCIFIQVHLGGQMRKNYRRQFRRQNSYTTVNVHFKKTTAQGIFEHHDSQGRQKRHFDTQGFCQ